MKYKLQTFISIVSMTVGMLCFALSAMWLHYEESYNKGWKDSDDIYLVQTSYRNGWGQMCDETLQEYFKSISPEIYDCTHLFDYDLYLGNGQIRGEKIEDSSQNFLGLKVKAGKELAKLGKNEIALSESCADRLYPDGNALGQAFNAKCYSIDDSIRVVIASIVEDPHKPISFPCDFFAKEEFPNYNGYVFVKVKRQDYQKLVNRLDTIKGFNYKKTFDDGPVTIYHKGGFRLLPLGDMREHVDIYYGKSVKTSYLRLFVMLGVIVILCALFNYFTMLVTHIHIRQREIALRYVNGSSRWQIVTLVSMEMMMVLVTSLLLSVLFLTLFLDDYMRLSHLVDLSYMNIYCRFFVFAAIASVISYILTMIVVAICCNKYLRKSLDKRSSPQESSVLYRTNICVQFIVSIASVFASFVVINQINFLLSSHEIGYSTHNLGQIGVHSREGISSTTFAKELETKLKSHPDIDTVLYAKAYPSNFNGINTGYFIDDSYFTFSCLPADADYCKLLQLQLVDGEYMHDGADDEVLITETAARILGKQGKVGERLYNIEEKAFRIVGIVKDVYYSPLQTPDSVIFVSSDDSYMSLGDQKTLLFKWKEGLDLTRIVDDVWDDLCRRGDSYYPMNLYIAESMLRNDLASEIMLRNLLVILASVCVLISVLGIFSIVSLACERRRKEIAIRKVHGAKTHIIMVLFLKEYVYMLLGSAVIAFPVGYYIMHQWVSTYIKQAPIYWWIYPAIIITMALLIFVTVFWQIRKAAKENPAEVMKAPS